MAEQTVTAVEAEYQSKIAADINSCIATLGCQPILFVGSGLSQRYFSGPSWDELLTYLAHKCPLITKDYAYYKQTIKDLPSIGEEFAKAYQEWAWGDGRKLFPDDMFTPETPPQLYIKYIIAEWFKSLTPTSVAGLSKGAFGKEIKALQSIKPHAIITTNYDRLLEQLFPDYQPVIGQQIFQGTQVLLGEIFKIHGCVSDPNTLVFSQSDYEQFTKKKKYLSAKLLTYFSEHPLLFIGYSASDPNIRAILSDVAECWLPDDKRDSLIPNIYILEWRKEMPNAHTPNTEKLVDVYEGKTVRIKAIETSDFEWPLSAFAAQTPLNSVSPKVLRALLSRSYHLVRHDIPRKKVQADFKMLEHAVESDEAFSTLFGITTMSSPTALTAQYPYTLTDLAEKIHGKGAYWAKAQYYLDKIKTDKGVDLKTNDNKYHCATKTGKKSLVHKYSDHLLDIARRIKKGEDYTLEL